MKKITLSLFITACLFVQANGQSGVNSNPSNLSRSGKGDASASTNNSNTFVNKGKTASFSSNQVLEKRGGVPAVAVAYTDDFSLPNDTNGLKARGYLPYYRGAGPQGTTASWYQGSLANWGDYNSGTADYVSSNYNSVTGTNNISNWLVLPALNVSAGDFISFYSRSPLGSTYPDSIRVLYSAAGDSTPEGLTWVELGRFVVDTAGVWDQALYSVSTAGATARFAINYSVVNGGPLGLTSDIIGIDQLDVFTPQTSDMQALSVSRLNSTYSIIPISQVSPISLSGVVKNNGISAATGGTALLEIYDTLSLAVIFTETVNLPNLAPGASATLNATNSYSPAAAAVLRGRITVAYPGDGNAANDIATSGRTEYSDSTFARDNGNSTGSLGIGAGPADGIVGQNFEIAAASTLRSVSFKIMDTFSPNPAGTPVYATIHAQTIGSEPSPIILATTDSVIILPGGIATGGEWFTVMLDAGALNLTSGLYFVGVHEVDSTLSLGTSTDIVTPGTVWVSWNAIPTPPAVNGWATADDFGFTIAYNLRINLGTASSVSEIEANSNVISLYPSPTSSELNIQLNKDVKNAKVDMYNSIGALVKTINNVTTSAKVDVSNFASGIYTLMVTADGKSYSKRFSVASK